MFRQTKNTMALKKLYLNDQGEEDSIRRIKLNCLDFFFWSVYKKMFKKCLWMSSCLVKPAISDFQFNLLHLSLSLSWIVIWRYSKDNLKINLKRIHFFSRSWKDTFCAENHLMDPISKFVLVCNEAWMNSLYVFLFICLFVFLFLSLFLQFYLGVFVFLCVSVAVFVLYVYELCFCVYVCAHACVEMLAGRG
jgi:hypothetical protein